MILYCIVQGPIVCVYLYNVIMEIVWESRIDNDQNWLLVDRWESLIEL